MAIINRQCGVFLLLLELMLSTPTIQRNVTKQNVYDEREGCGESNALLVRVVGGTESPINAWPWAAAIYLLEEYKNKPKLFYCGGAVISHKHILSTGHCGYKRPRRIPAEKLEAHLGDHDLTSDLDGATPVIYRMEEIIIHENYIVDTIDFDIALLKVKGWITYSHAIKPICLPTKEMSAINLENMRPYFAGWGRLAFRGALSDKLRHVQLEVFPNERCERVYADHGYTVGSSHLCVGHRQGGKDTCQGDSGGSLMIPLKNRWYTIGLVVLGVECGKPEYPGIFTKVASYIDWLHTNMNH